MKHLALVFLLLASFTAAAKPTAPAAASAVVTPNAAPPATLQAACVNKIKPTLKGAERIRDIGSVQGKIEHDIVFAVSENGGKTKAVACQVQKDGTLKLVNKGYVKSQG